VRFAQLPGMAKDVGDFDGQQETDLTLSFPQTKEPFFGWHQLLLEMSKIDGVGKITGAEQGNTLALRPPRQAFYFHGAATGGAETRMDVEVSNNAHSGAFR
jgi:hypothetical protein